MVMALPRQGKGEDAGYSQSGMAIFEVCPPLETAKGGTTIQLVRCWRGWLVSSASFRRPSRTAGGEATIQRPPSCMCGAHLKQAFQCSLRWPRTDPVRVPARGVERPVEGLVYSQPSTANGETFEILPLSLCPLLRTELSVPSARGCGAGCRARRRNGGACALAACTCGFPLPPRSDAEAVLLLLALCPLCAARRTLCALGQRSWPRMARPAPERRGPRPRGLRRLRFFTPTAHRPSLAPSLFSSRSPLGVCATAPSLCPWG